MQERVLFRKQFSLVFPFDGQQKNCGKWGCDSILLVVKFGESLSNADLRKSTHFNNIDQEKLMFPLLLLIISYESLLVLLMPATGIGIISTAVMLIAGLAFILYKKAYFKIAFWKSRQYYAIPAALFATSSCGRIFYNRWLPSSKMQAIAAMIHMPIETFLLICTVVLSVLSVYFIYVVLQAIIKKLYDADEKNDFAWSILASVIAAVITVVLTQIMIDTEVLSMGYGDFIWAVLIVLAVILFLFCLLGKAIPSILLGSGIFMIISTVNVYVYSFRERLFEPVDIFSAGTAMNVAENYNLLPIPINIITGWGIFAALMIILYCSQRNNKSKLTIKRRIALLAVCMVSFVAIFFYTTNLKTYHWHKEGALFNGYILDFVSKFKEITASEPENYSYEMIAELAEQYASNKTESEIGQADTPHIIVIMDESFSDLHVVGDFSTNTEVIPFISSLKENTISGYTLVSVVVSRVMRKFL